LRSKKKIVKSGNVNGSRRRRVDKPRLTNVVPEVPYSTSVESLIHLVAGVAWVQVDDAQHWTTKVGTQG